MNWFGLGKPRSKFGRWIDERDISQQEVSDKSGVSNTALSRLANDDDARPSFRNRKKLKEAMRDFDEEFSDDDFWGD